MEFGIIKDKAEDEGGFVSGVLVAPTSLFQSNATMVFDSAHSFLAQILLFILNLLP